MSPENGQNRYEADTNLLHAVTILLQGGAGGAGKSTRPNVRAPPPVVERPRAAARRRKSGRRQLRANGGLSAGLLGCTRRSRWGRRRRRHCRSRRHCASSRGRRDHGRR
jgi:hypothetical protein